MKKIQAKPIDIYKMYNAAIKESLLIDDEKNIIEQLRKTKGVTDKDSGKFEIDKTQKEIEIREIIMKRISKILKSEESTFSTSTIEGVRINEDDISKFSNGIKDSNVSKDDIREILNLNELLLTYQFPSKISLEEIKKLHKFAYVDKRKKPGYLKASNNKVNLFTGDELEYISVSETLTEMNKIIDFINDAELDKHPLIKAAIIHVYFALIHPFQDGNGRITRLLVNKYLTKQLDYDIYIDSSIKSLEDYSKYLTYFNDELRWPLYFGYHNNLVHNSLLRSEERCKKLFNQWNLLTEELKTTSIPNSKLNQIIEFIQSNNIFSIKVLQDSLSITRVTATKYTKELVKMNIYEEYDHTQGKLYKKKEAYIITINI